MAGKTTKVKRKVKDPAKADTAKQKVEHEDRKNGASAKKGAGTRTGAMDRMRGDIQKIAKDLQGGAKMKDVRNEYGFGSGGAIRAELAKNGYDSKGGTITLPTLPKSTKARAKALAALRTAGTPWYILVQVTGNTEAEVREIVETAGGPTVRVYRNATGNTNSQGAHGTKATKATKATVKRSTKGAGEVTTRQMTKAELAAARKAKAVRKATVK